ncbi:MAG TPA: hypothetical protein VIS07_01890 [Candidatus Binatia bacterium]
MEGSSSPKLAALLAFFHRFGEVMGGIVLGFLYFVLLGPVALVVRLATDPLRRRRPGDTAFVPWQKDNETLAAAHRQG